MNPHPLLELSQDKEIRKAAGFRAAAAELTGEALAAHYQAEKAGAPRRHEAGKKYFVAYNSRLAAERRPARDSEHLSLALVEHCKRSGGGVELPDDEGTVEFVHAQLPLKSAAAEKDRPDDPNRGVPAMDLIGLGPDDRMVVGRVRWVPPSGTRVGTGDTPLRALLEGLACAAIAESNRADLSQEVAERAGRAFSEEPPLLILLGSRRYWELCRKREAQKGAAWIQQMERLAAEVHESTGVTVMYLACELEGDPGFGHAEGTPVLDGTPRIVDAWEPGAGRVRPKPRSRPKPSAPAELIVEADLSRPVRPYDFTESYLPADRIEHATLGIGVVQGPAGPGKISVLFGDRKSLLVHERPARKSAPAAPAPPAPPGESG